MKGENLCLLWLWTVVVLTLLFATDKPAKGETRTLACFGDSVTLGRHVQPSPTYCDVLAREARYDNVVNAGIGGDNTQSARERFDADVLKHSPHTLVIMFGLNDSFVDPGYSVPRVSVSAYRRNLTYFVKAAKRHKVRRIVLVTPNATAYERENAWLQPYVASVRKMIRSRKTLGVDFYLLTSRLKNERDDVFTDGVHPAAWVHEALGNRIAENLHRSK